MDQRTTTLPSGSRSHRGAASARCEVHVGRIGDLRAAHLLLLDHREVARARQFRQAADSNRCLLGAVLLRVTAARHLGVRPADVTVDRTCGRCGAEHGRPQLPGSGLNASVSHSGDIVAVAITFAGPVGVDVEAVRAIDFTAVAESVCTPAELTDLHVAADFYTFWTRKEAVLKATGEGLSRPMTDLHVTPPGSAPALLGLAGGRAAGLPDGGHRCGGRLSSLHSCAHCPPGRCRHPGCGRDARVWRAVITRLQDRDGMPAIPMRAGPGGLPARRWRAARRWPDSGNDGAESMSGRCRRSERGRRGSPPGRGTR